MQLVEYRPTEKTEIEEEHDEELKGIWSKITSNLGKNTIDHVEEFQQFIVKCGKSRTFSQLIFNAACDRLSKSVTIDSFICFASSIQVFLYKNIIVRLYYLGLLTFFYIIDYVTYRK
jgi:hypothetical protein